MATLHIEHAVPDYAAWKRAFDADPMNRKASGVRSYRVFRRSADPNYVVVQLDFDAVSEAEELLAKLRKLWGTVDVMQSPQAQVLETAESQVL